MNCGIFNGGWEEGLEPTTFRTTIVSSNHLNYAHRVNGFDFKASAKLGNLFGYAK